jgi:hypothetical protein
LLLVVISFVKEIRPLDNKFIYEGNWSAFLFLFALLLSKLFFAAAIYLRNGLAVLVNFYTLRFAGFPGNFARGHDVFCVLSIIFAQ